jgi:hypothetical protein
VFAFISLLFDLSHADVDLVTREFRIVVSGESLYVFNN